MAGKKRKERQTVHQSQPENLEAVFMHLEKYPETKQITLEGKTIGLETELGHEERVCVQVFVHRLFFIRLGVTGEVRVWYMLTPWRAREKTEQEVIIQMKCRTSFSLAVKDAGWHELDGIRYYLVQGRSTEYNYSGGYYPILWAYVLLRKDALMRAIMRQGLEDEQEIVTAALVSARLAKTISKSRVPVMDIDTGVMISIEPVQFEDVLFQMIFGYYLRKLQTKKFFNDRGGGNAA